jgi:hypothetical protein
MEELTTRTGSLEFGVAVEGFTIFMVRPWRMVQLVGTEEMIYPLQSSSAGAIPSYSLFTTLPIFLTNVEPSPFGSVRACWGHDLPNA